tara:strand:+ start:478 stop:717 length:240 start_codon:yes stop_codon:yes gene_type:complete
MSIENEMVLTDEAIAGIAKLLQVAILTGTDIVDNLRTMRLVQVEDKLTLSPGFVESLETNIANMLTEAEGLQVPDPTQE